MVSLRKKLMITRRNEQFPNEQTQLKFLKRLYRLLGDGYPLIKALEVIGWDTKMEQTVQIITQTLLEGKYIDEAFSAARFHKLILVYLYFVRINRDLESSLKRSITMFEQRLASIQKFRQVTRYPLILSFIFIVLLFFIKTSILPTYVEMFQSYSSNSKTVQLIIFIINSLLSGFFIVITISLITTLYWYFYRRKVPVEQQLKIYSKIPVLRDFIKMQTSFYFATHVSMFLQTGMSMNHLLKFMEEQNELPIISHYSSAMRKHLSNGYALNELLLSLPFIDSQLAILFQRNNEQNALGKDLHAYSDMVSENLELKIMRAIGFIQPVFLVFLGSFIVFIYLSLMWPMFQLINSV